MREGEGEIYFFEEGFRDHLIVAADRVTVGWTLINSTIVSLYNIEMLFTRANGKSFWEFLTDLGQKYDKSDFPFLTGDEVPRVKPVFDFSDYLRLTGKGEALAYLYKGLGKAPTYVGMALDSELDFGFNDHTDRHTLWVASNTVDILNRAGVTWDGSSGTNTITELLALLVGMTHDLGNLLDRKRHSSLSVQILDSMFVVSPEYNDIWQAVKRTILYHDEFALVEGGFSLNKGGPLLWALVLADKMHVGRDRLGEKSIKLGQDGSAEKDVHVTLNMLISRSVWYIDPESFTWKLDFSVELGQERMMAMTNEKDRVWVPEHYQKAYRKEGILYRETFAEEFMKVYGERNKLLRKAAGLLFPWVKGFKLYLVDSDSRGKVKPEKVLIWKD